jgi:hypothetical protein
MMKKHGYDSKLVAEDIDLHPEDIKIIWEKECNEPKQETLEEVAKQEAVKFCKNGGSFTNLIILGAKWQQEQDKNKYSEEDLREAFRQGQDNMDYSDIYGLDSKLTESEWFKQFKKK